METEVDSSLLIQVSNRRPAKAKPYLVQSTLLDFTVATATWHSRNPTWEKMSLAPDKGGSLRQGKKTKTMHDGGDTTRRRTLGKKC